MLKVCALVVQGVPFDQLHSILRPPVFIFVFWLFPVRGFMLTLSIVNLAVFVGVKTIEIEFQLAINRSVYVPLAHTAVPEEVPIDGVTVPTVQFVMV